MKFISILILFVMAMLYGGVSYTFYLLKFRSNIDKIEQHKIFMLRVALMLMFIYILMGGWQFIFWDCSN